MKVKTFILAFLMMTSPFLFGHVADEITSRGNLGASTLNGVSNTNTETVVLFSGNFDDNNLDGWTLIDANGDGYNWAAENGYIFSKSYVNGSAITTEDYIITEKAYYQISEASVLTFKVGPTHSSYNVNNNYGVIISEDNINFDIISSEKFDDNNNITKLVDRTVELTAYAGKTLYIGFLHHMQEKEDNSDGIKIDDVVLTGTVATAVAKIGTQEFETLADAIAKAKSGDEIIMLDNATLGEELTIPAGITLNGNGYQIEGSIVAAGDLTFAGHTKVTSFNAGYNKPVITIGEGACLEMNGTGRMVIGHGATFNINGTIADAKTAAGVTRAATDLTPSLIMPGASFTGAGVTFNVNNAYIKTTASYCSSSKSASGTFDFNIENSIWEQFGKLAFESQSTAATVNFELKNSVLTTTSHLVFGVSRGEIIIDNSYVNKGTTRQIENQSTMTVKNGSVVNGAVATSSNAKNPGTLIVDNATYSVTGEFSGSDLGTGTLIMKNGASFTAGSITKANIQIDAEGLAVGNEININAKLDNHVGTLEVINNNNLDAKIENGKIVLVEKPVAQIGNKGYNSLLTALSEAKDNETVVMNVDVELTTRLIFASYTNGKQVTLDGNGNRLYASSTNWGTGNGKHLINVNCDNVTLRNVVLDCNNIAEGANIYKAQNIVFDNVSIINKKGWNADLTVNGSTLTVENKLSASYVDIDLGSGVTTPLGIVAAEGAVLDTKTLQIDAAAYPNTNLDNALSTDGTSYYSLKKVDANGNLTGYSNSLSRLSSGYGYEMLEDMTVNSDVILLNADHTGTLNTNGHTLTIADGKSLTVNGALNVEGEGTIKGNIILGNSDASVSGVEGLEIKSTVEGAEVVYQDGKYIVAIYVAQVGDTKYDDLQEAIVAAAPAGEVNILSDITVDKWIMFSERLSIGSGQIITINKIDGLTINGNNHSLTINSIESASNGNRLFYDATELNIKDLTINYKEGVVGGIGLTSGTINKVTFNGGVGVLPGTGEITISGCTFNTSGSAIYNEEDRDNLVVTGNTFNTAEGQYAIYLRGNTTFTNNIVKVGKVNVTNSGTGLISGNDFGTERFKVYNAATATIEDNKINNLVFNDESVVCSTFGENELSAEAQAVLDAASFPVAQIGTTKYGTLQEAVNVGGNITILSDITLTETVKVAAGKTVTLDLNGKTIDYNPEVWTYGAANSGTALLTVNFGGNLTIEDSSAEKTGTIDASYREENWDNYTYDVYGAVMMTAAGDNAENGTAKLTVNGGTLKGFFAAVAGNRNRDNTDITINDGYLTVEISDKFSTTGIEHPMNGKLTISGGKIEGMDGISFRSGTLVITGGTIIGNAPESAFEPDGYWDNNFAACTGHALQIVNRANSEPTNETPNVTITGGTFIAENTTAVASYAGYKGNTPDTQIVNFISGGTFNGEIEQNLLAPGFELKDNENGTYGVERNYQIWDGISINTNWYNTTDTEFILYTADDLAGFAAIANGTADGISADYFEGKTIKLGANIDLNNQLWAPIGGRTSSTLSGQIECTFDGQGYTISNLKVKKGEAYEAVNMNIGLFGITRTGKFVAKNFTLENVDVYGSASVAAVLGRTVNCKAVIENVTVKGLIKLEASTQNIAAICAQAYMPVINNCHVIGSDGSYIKAGTVQVGGIVGWSGESSKVTSITECSIENVTISANAYVGAIASILQYGATATNNNAKNVVLNVGEDEYHYGTIVGSVGAGYIANNGNPTAPVTLNENTTENVTVTLNGTTVESPIEYGAHYDKDTYLIVRIGNDYYEDLNVALNAGGNITVLRDVTLTETVTVPADKVVTLDLNGKTIDGTENCKIAIMSYGNLTVKDSTEEATGAIKAGVGTAGNAVNICAGTFTLESGNIYSKNNAILIDEQAAIVNIIGGNITAEPTTNNSAVFYISSTSETTVNIEGGEMTGYNGVLLWNNTTLNITGGTITGKGKTAIQGNGTHDNTEINISENAAIIAENNAAIYHPQGGELNISGGTITGTTGIIVKGGKVNISAGTINGIGEANDYRPVSSGFESTGDALYVEHYDNSTNSGNYGTPTVIVTGGTFNSTNAAPIASYANPNNAGNGVEALAAFISGGTFNGEIEQNLLAEGFELVQNEDGTYGVVESLLKGKGTEDNPYLIENLEDLIAFRDDVNAGNNYKGEYVKLVANINLNNEEWSPIGTPATPFKGNFDGDNNTIENLNVIVEEGKEDKAYIGFFGYADGVTIKNLNFENVNLNIACLDIDHSQGHIGAVAGSLEGTSTIENVTVTGDVKVEATFDANGASRVAVVAGGNSYGNVTMRNVHVNANEGSYLIANNNVGALAGQLQGKNVFENCSSNIDVTAKKFFAGGLIGLAAGDSKFTDCHTTGDVTVTAGREGRANDHYRVGGIAGGWADSKTKVCTLTNCTYTGKISGTNADGSVVTFFDYAGYVGRGYGLTNCAGSKVIIDDVEYVQAYNTNFGVYEINGNVTLYKAEDLKAFANEVNGGNSHQGKNVVLAADIDLNNEEWTPIGSINTDHGFMGNFDGKTYKIKNLTITNPSLDSDGYAYAGLFGITEGTDKDNQNVIKNLTIENVTINTTGHIVSAAIAYPYYTIVENVTVSGNIAINGGDYTSGVLAYTRRCVNASGLTVVANEGSYITGAKTVGGVISDIQMNGGLTAEYSDFNVSDVTINGEMHVGGISGIISEQALDGCSVTNVVLNCDNSRVGIVSGSLGGVSAISNVVYENVTGATAIIGGDYSNGDVVEARIENKYYSTLKAALAAANNETVTLIADTELAEMITISNGKTVTLDLNGKTITGTDNTSKNFSIIDNRGNLTITDSSEPSTGKITLTATVNSGWSRYSAVIANNPGGKLTIEAGTIEHLGGTDMAYGIDNLTNGKGTYAETVINGGYIKSTYRGIRQFLNGVEAQNILTVNSGTIEGANKSIWMQDPSKNANTGTLTVGENAKLIGDVYLFVTAGSTEWPVEISIAAAALQGESTVLTGNVPAGYDVQNINGTYSKVNVVAQIGDEKYQTLADAVATAQDGETIQLIWAEGNAPIAMNANLFGKNITITGTATVDWNKNFLFVGRGGEGNATLTFDNANLTSASNSASYGIHVSGREKNTNNKYDGTLIIKNSTIELDYLINKGAITLDNSEFTVKNGFSIGGRPASETESGVDATATITLNNGSKVIVNDHNGMGLGYEAIGVMNIDATSTFETTQAFLITAKGTLNNAGTVNINGALTNNGTINFTDLGATLTTTTEDLNINDLIDDIEYKIVYEDETYKYIQMPSQEQSLVAGWNWYSSYLDITLNDLTTVLGENGSYIKNFNGTYVENIGGNLWIGELEAINPSEMYLVQTTTECDLKLAADLVNPNDHIISLNANWNWIGYPSNQGVNINVALENLEANPGDIIKSLNNGYAEYAFGQWLGTLNTMVPGVGYKYNNKSGEAKTFYYNIEATRGAVEANVTAENNYWTPNATKYPHNMTMTAVVDGMTNSNYEVAAFVNGEVRGSARPIYVEALDAHIFFLTIHGEDVEEMAFRLYDIDTDTEYDLNDRINYSNDAHLGSVNEPYVFSRGTTGIGEAAMSQVNIYPNPTTTGSTINLQATCDKVEVYNALGVLVAEYQNVDSIDALETAGIYVIRITNDGNTQNCRLVVK